MWGQVHYNDVTVGEYFADPLVEDVPVVEANAVKALDDTHLAPGACPGDAMRQLSQGNLLSTLPAVQFRQAAPGDKCMVHGLWTA